MNNNKKGFSLIELIFAIVILGIISTVAIPRLMSLDSKANISTIKQDTNSIISSIQSYYIMNHKIDKITDAISINPVVWNITDKTIKYIHNEKDCINITVTTNTLILNIDANSSDICKKLNDQGIVNQTFNLD